MTVRYLNVFALSGGSPAAELARSASKPDAPVYAIDVDDLLPVLPAPSDEAAAMHAERQATYWAEEFDRLRPALGGHPVAAKLNLEPLLDAARLWLAEPFVDRPPTRLEAALAIELNNLTAAAAGRSVLGVPAHSLLTPPEWQALLELRLDIENDAPRSSALNDGRAALVASAIDKLTMQAAGRGK